MAGSGKNILITGYPGTGKTTLITRLARTMMNNHPVGFYTAEIRKQGIRQGFELLSLDGQRGLLAHVDIQSPLHVGKYGVDVKGFEKFIERIDFLGARSPCVIIDEIGKMECLSKRFCSIVMSLLDSDKTFIATVAYKGPAFITDIKKRGDVLMMELQSGNADDVFTAVLSEITVEPQ
ncbi:MAG TPA: nucleoside-triphosphatase [Deltaproteobacteria bacterium]|nr:nucleoside-triphosphatase [Deltaproteobacteria bacterium]HPJ93961.1 nucleoside-triphosphatase [Deltaproteobacteria bacterium]HPR51348.1 nucleoside-triphosphatase [Deltaproteobacteria bacterium]